MPVILISTQEVGIAGSKVQGSWIHTAWVTRDYLKSKETNYQTTTAHSQHEVKRQHVSVELGCV